MKTLFALTTVVVFAATTAFAGPTGKGSKTTTEGRTGLSEAATKTMRTALETAGMKGEIAEQYKRAGLPEMKADVLNKLSALKGESKATAEKLLSTMTNTVINAKSISTLGENGKLILEAASKMATSVVETIANDKSGSVDLAKIEKVAKLLEDVSSINDLKNEGTLVVKISEINAELGSGRTIKDLKDCF